MNPPNPLSAPSQDKASWLDAAKMDQIPYGKIAWPLLLGTDSILVGAIYLLFVNLFSFEWLVTT